MEVIGTTCCDTDLQKCLACEYNSLECSECDTGYELSMYDDCCNEDLQDCFSCAINPDQC